MENFEDKSSKGWTNALSHFSTVSLMDLSPVANLNRRDTKFIFNEQILSDLLTELIPHYSILEIDSHRLFEYQNRYFDTTDFLLYMQHHNGVRPRFKVRFRKYETGTQFFEIKEKNNQGRTIKRRILADPESDTFAADQNALVSFITDPMRELLVTESTIEADQFLRSVFLNYSRLTLVDRQFQERITIDSNVISRANGNWKGFPGLAIAEVKQQRFNPKSTVIRAMGKRSIISTRFSKYCIGIHHHFTVKYNRFKPRLLRMDRIMSTAEKELT